ncbi:complex I assembly factor TIMMDC1, mitochondrial-like [Clytia hemisphaerica]|uniref:complex I assembly factor TIMMDC1, mitochondrial-like n=1 Tax=Clytia hemisphaerica TaxID=252671 RepID=UPI0034D71A46
MVVLLGQVSSREMQNIISSYEERKEKVKNLFKPDNEGHYNRNLFLVSQCVCGGSLAGFLIGGRIGARVGAVEHIENTTLSVYTSSVHAQREYHGRVFMGFLRNGSKFGWRAGVFSGLYSLLLVTLNEASDTNNNASSFLISGALTGIVYKCLSGWRSMVVGAIIGSALSVPPALFTASINQFASEEVKSQLSIFYLDERAETTNQDGSRNNDSDLATSPPQPLDVIIGSLSQSLHYDQQQDEDGQKKEDQ